MGMGTGGGSVPLEHHLRRLRNSDGGARNWRPVADVHWRCSASFPLSVSLAEPHFQSVREVGPRRFDTQTLADCTRRRRLGACGAGNGRGGKNSRPQCAQQMLHPANRPAALPMEPPCSHNNGQLRSSCRGRGGASSCVHHSVRVNLNCPLRMPGDSHRGRDNEPPSFRKLKLPN